MTLPATPESTKTEGSTNLFIIERFDNGSVKPTRWFGADNHNGSVYVVRQGDDILWTVGIDYSEASHVPFRDELFWEKAGVVVIGGGDVVHFFDAESGELRAKIAVPSLFGHLALSSVPTSASGTEELLFILGWTDVHAIDRYLETRWIARNVAVDGITFGEVRDGKLMLSAEMDPPGGWVDVALDLFTGAELSRRT